MFTDFNFNAANLNHVPARKKVLNLRAKVDTFVRAQMIQVSDNGLTLYFDLFPESNPRVIASISRTDFVEINKRRMRIANGEINGFDNAQGFDPESYQRMAIDLDKLFRGALNESFMAIRRAAAARNGIGTMSPFSPRAA